MRAPQLNAVRWQEVEGIYADRPKHIAPALWHPYLSNVGQWPQHVEEVDMKVVTTAFSKYKYQ